VFTCDLNSILRRFGERRKIEKVVL